jgi:hypothetical protein
LRDACQAKCTQKQGLYFSNRLSGGEKDIAYKNSEIDYQQIDGIPLFNANLDNAGQNGSLSQPFGGKMAQAARLWLQWQLKGDREAGKAFVGPDCMLCKDPNWVVKKKNMKSEDGHSGCAAGSEQDCNRTIGLAG